jgi:hypothetical protein
MMSTVLYCGDPHGRFRHIIEAAGHTRASAVVLLGDLEPQRPLHVELAPLIERGVPVWYIHGNHDADSDELWMRLWGSELAECNVHGRVVTLPDGQRLAGLGGVFRESVWYPSSSATRDGAPAFRSMREHARSTGREWPSPQALGHHLSGGCRPPCRPSRGGSHHARGPRIPPKRLRAARHPRPVNGCEGGDPWSPTRPYRQL